MTVFLSFRVEYGRKRGGRYWLVAAGPGNGPALLWFRREPELMAEGKGKRGASPDDFLKELESSGRIPGGRGGKKLRSFLDHGEHIRKALEAGYTVKDVWTALRSDGRVLLSYSLFSEYVRTKLRLEPRRVLQEPEGGAEPQLSDEARRHRELVYGTPERGR